MTVEEEVLQQTDNSTHSTNSRILLKRELLAKALPYRKIDSRGRKQSYTQLCQSVTKPDIIPAILSCDFNLICSYGFAR